MYICTYICVRFSILKFALPIPVFAGKYYFYCSTKHSTPRLISRFESQVTVLSLQQFLTGLPVLGFGEFPPCSHLHWQNPQLTPTL